MYGDCAFSEHYIYITKHPDGLASGCAYDKQVTTIVFLYMKIVLYKRLKQTYA